VQIVGVTLGVGVGICHSFFLPFLSIRSLRIKTTALPRHSCDNRVGNVQTLSPESTNN
jgi:hypothetical protein